MNIESTIERYLVDEILLGDGATRINPDESLIDSGILDSLALLRFINFLEDQFSVTVDDLEVVPDNFQTINVTKAFIEKKLQNG
jgi:acyl carrier protein